LTLEVRKMKSKVAAVATRIAVVTAVAVLLVGGAAAVYLYTSAPKSTFTSTGETQTGASSQSQASPSGYCTTNAQGQCTGPQGAWSDYLGYIPSGYVTVPHSLNSFTYPCPSGMDQTQCQQFQASCGNGVCDPNESCTTCPIDCSVPGQLTCDPYTGRAGAPISICQLGNGGG